MEDIFQGQSHVIITGKLVIIIFQIIQGAMDIINTCLMPIPTRILAGTGITGTPIMAMLTGITGLTGTIIIYLLMHVATNIQQNTNITITSHLIHTFINMLTGISLIIMLSRIMDTNT